MYLSKKSIYLYVYFFLITLFISFAVANRDIYDVPDTENYANNFLGKTNLHIHHEFLFEFLTYLIRIFTDSYIIYFFIINFILNFIILKIFIKISEIFYFNKFYFSIFSFGILIFSSWYYVAATNGLRQGLALVFVYYSFFIYLAYKKKLKSILLFGVSCFFHYSNFLIIPFLFLYKLNFNKLFILLNITGLFYVFGFNELIIKLVSESLSLPIYTSIKYYTQDGAESYRYGLQWDLFLYTLVFVYSYWWVCKYFLKENLYLINLVKFFYILVFVYFVFGFAGFSNRYAVISWFFSVFINCIILYSFLLKSKKNYFEFFFIAIIALSCIFFIYRFF